MSDEAVEILRAIVRCADESHFANLCDRDHGPASESWPSQSDELHTAIESARAFLSISTGKDDNMVEIVTRAVEHCRVDCYGTDEDIARAAIAAMREPSTDMERAGEVHMESGLAVNVWESMIDAALR